jgi:hypothetical protein
MKHTSHLFELLRLAEKFNFAFLLPAIHMCIHHDYTLTTIMQAKLSPNQIERLVLGRIRIVRNLRSTFFGDVFDRDYRLECPEGEEHCTKEKYQFMLETFCDGADDSGVLWFIFGGSDVFRRFDFSDINNLCQTCKQKLEKGYLDGCNRVWDELPRYLPLGSWEELKRARDQGIQQATYMFRLQSLISRCYARSSWRELRFSARPLTTVLNILV